MNCAHVTRLALLSVTVFVCSVSLAMDRGKQKVQICRVFCGNNMRHAVVCGQDTIAPREAQVVEVVGGMALFNSRGYEIGVPIDPSVNAIELFRIPLSLSLLRGDSAEVETRDVMVPKIGMLRVADDQTVQLFSDEGAGDPGVPFGQLVERYRRDRLEVVVQEERLFLAAIARAQAKFARLPFTPASSDRNRGYERAVVECMMLGCTTVCASQESIRRLREILPEMNWR